jgi:lipoyl(octanoyl) transferase
MVRTEWCFLDTGTRSGAFNMHLDTELACRLQAGEGLPVLRLFRWSPWAISLGHNQSLEDIDLEACRRDGIDVVRRPTGGRAILHAEEVTYSVVMFSGGRGILDVYNDISRALVRGLALYGVETALQKTQPDFQSAYRHASSIPCFTSSARYEIERDGRKLVGSAQRRFGEGERGVVLQHGSILCGSAHRRLAKYLRVEDPALRERLRREMQLRTIDLAEIQQRPVDVDGLLRCLRQGFEQEWDIVFADADPGSFSDHQIRAGLLDVVR